MAKVHQVEVRGGEFAARSAEVLAGRVLNGLPEKRQNIDLMDVPLREALKRVLDDSKTAYVLDDDVPNEPRVTIKLTNAPLTTILDALTLSNNIGWRTELKLSKSDTDTSKPAAKDEKQSNEEKQRTEERAANRGSALGTYLSALTVTAGAIYVPHIHVGKTVKSLPNSFQGRVLIIDGPPVNIAPDVLRGTVVPQAPQLRIYRWQNQKRTFTCPRCHNTISILHEPEEVKCTKCQRHFEDSWKVCPFDGTKRPEPKGKWRFCPICGKTITLETSWSQPTSLLNFGDSFIPSYLESEQIHPNGLRFFPGLADVEDLDDHVHELIPAEESIIGTEPALKPHPELLLQP
ncbi:MAG: hypothetical protein V4671_18040 [Armatimonadota bacterium]